MPEAAACKGADADSLASAAPDEAAPSWLLVASWTPRGSKMLFNEGWIFNSINNQKKYINFGISN